MAERKYQEFSPAFLQDIKVASVKLPNQQEPIECFVCQLEDGSRVISAGVFVSGLVYQRMTEELKEDLRVDESKWDWQQGIFRGGLSALGVEPDKAQAELALFEQAQPDCQAEELLLGPAVELDANGQPVTLDDDIGVWMVMHQGAEVQIIERLREVPQRVLVQP